MVVLLVVYEVKDRTGSGWGVFNISNLQSS